MFFHIHLNMFSNRKEWYLIKKHTNCLINYSISLDAFASLAINKRLQDLFAKFIKCGYFSFSSIIQWVGVIPQHKSKAEINKDNTWKRKDKTNMDITKLLNLNIKLLNLKQLNFIITTFLNLTINFGNFP